VPITADSIALFCVQNTFMYSVFESSMHTAKSCHVVRTHETSAIAQDVYAGLLMVYDKDFTTSLAATDLQSELSLLCFDDSWKKGSEAFLLHWQCKILEQEPLQDKRVDDDTKHLRLTATLSTKSNMTSCLTQAKVTELTMLSMGISTGTQMPWENFYNLVLSQTKLHDHTTPTKPKRETHLNEPGRSRGEARIRGRRGRGIGRTTPGRVDTKPTRPTNSSAEKVWTTVTSSRHEDEGEYALHRRRVPKTHFRAKECIANRQQA
jgi:hypothetical protein